MGFSLSFDDLDAKRNYLNGYPKILSFSRFFWLFGELDLVLLRFA